MYRQQFICVEDQGFKNISLMSWPMVAFKGIFRFLKEYESNAILERQKSDFEKVVEHG